MQITFIQPPIEDFYSTPIRRHPLGLLYLAAIAKQEGFQVELINGHSPKNKVLPIPKEFSYLKEFIDHNQPEYQFPFKNYYHFGLSFEKIAELIKKSNSEIFAISALFTPYYQEVDQIIALVKQLKPKAKIIIGGGHASLYPEYYLGRVDHVITGEGELKFLEIIKAIKAGQKIGFNRELELVEDLDALPFPERSLLQARDFKIYKKRGATLFFSRGCPHGCKFCTGHRQFGRKYRFRSIENLIAELDECYKKYNCTFFNFEDDNLFFSPKIASKLLNALIKYQEQNKIKFDLAAMNGVSLENIKPEFIPELKKAGFSEINISLVSQDSSLQKTLNRPFDTNQVEQIAKTAQKFAMNVRCYFILGLPEQTKAEIEATLSFLNKLGVKAIPSIYYNVFAPKEQWKIQRSAGFANETKYLQRKDLLFFFNQSIK